MELVANNENYNVIQEGVRLSVVYPSYSGLKVFVDLFKDCVP